MIKIKNIFKAAPSPLENKGSENYLSFIRMLDTYLDCRLEPEEMKEKLLHFCNSEFNIFFDEIKKMSPHSVNTWVRKEVYAVLSDNFKLKK